MVIDYFVNVFSNNLVVIVGVIGAIGAFIIIGRGRNKDEALKDFSNKISMYGHDCKVGKELSNPGDDLPD